MCRHNLASVHYLLVKCSQVDTPAFRRALTLYRALLPYVQLDSVRSPFVNDIDNAQVFTSGGCAIALRWTEVFKSSVSHPAVKGRTAVSPIPGSAQVLWFLCLASHESRTPLLHESEELTTPPFADLDDTHAWSHMWMSTQNSVATLGFTMAMAATTNPPPLTRAGSHIIMDPICLHATNSLGFRGTLNP